MGRRRRNLTALNLGFYGHRWRGTDVLGTPTAEIKNATTVKCTSNVFFITSTLLLAQHERKPNVGCNRIARKVGQPV